MADFSSVAVLQNGSYKYYTLKEGTGVTFAESGTDLTISSSGGGGGAPTDATYVVMSATGALSAERVLTAGTGISITDGGAGNPVTIAATGGGITALTGARTHQHVRTKSAGTFSASKRRDPYRAAIPRGADSADYSRSSTKT